MTRRHGWIVVVAAVAALVLTGGAAAAGDDDRVKIERKGKVKIVTEDEHGEMHEQTFDWEGDDPRPFLGVATSPAKGGGAKIEMVVDDSAAARAGLRKGDVLVRIDGDSIDNPWDLTRRIWSAQPGEVVELEFSRDGKRQTVTAELGEREGGFAFFGPHDFDFEGLSEDMERLHEQLGEMDFQFEMPHFERRGWFGHGRPRLGVQLVQPTDELREHLGGTADAGVLVSRVLPDTPAEQAGIRVGDLIVAIDGRDVESARDLIDALRASEGRTVELELIRERSPMSVTALIPERERRERVRGPRA